MIISKTYPEPSNYDVLKTCLQNVKGLHLFTIQETVVIFAWNLMIMINYLNRKCFSLVILKNHHKRKDMKLPTRGDNIYVSKLMV